MEGPISAAATAIGRLALAAAFNGPMLAQIASGRAGERAPAAAAGGDTAVVDQGLPQAAVYAAMAGGWLGERRRLLGHNLEKDARAMVHLKDLLVASVMLTGLANIAAERLMRQVYPDGIKVTRDCRLAPDAPAGAEYYRRYFRIMGTLNRVLVAAAVAATPFINFALFNDYRPNPVPRFFKL